MHSAGICSAPGIAKRERALIAAARQMRACGDDAEAVRVLSFVVDRDPLAEDAFAELMRLHLDHGHPAEAVRAYERCAAAMAAELGVEPGEELRHLLARVRTGRTRRAPATEK